MELTLGGMSRRAVPLDAGQLSRQPEHLRARCSTPTLLLLEVRLCLKRASHSQSTPTRALESNQSLTLVDANCTAS